MSSRQKTQVKRVRELIEGNSPYTPGFFRFESTPTQMRIRKSTVLNILVIVLILSFFVTPLGDYSKLFLNQLFSFSPDVVEENQRRRVSDYDWQLKDDNGESFNFRRSEGNVVFINLWNSWRLPCTVELRSIQKLYDRYKGQIDFYIVTDEQQPPVRAFLEKHDLTFPVTYLIYGEKSPVDIQTPPRTYILDKTGAIVVDEEGIADWDNDNVYELMETLLKSK